MAVVPKGSYHSGDLILQLSHFDPALNSDLATIVLWKDGVVICSGHECGYGPPYYYCKLSQDKLNTIQQRFQQFGIVNSKLRTNTRLVHPDYLGITSFLTIRHDGKFIRMHSMHYLEYLTQFVLTATGFSILGDRKLYDMYFDCNQFQLIYRLAWNESELLVRRMLPPVMFPIRGKFKSETWKAE
jgi:hypothetical protein